MDQLRSRPGRVGQNGDQRHERTFACRMSMLCRSSSVHGQVTSRFAKSMLNQNRSVPVRCLTTVAGVSVDGETAALTA